jgi:hypothetical protein
MLKKYLKWEDNMKKLEYEITSRSYRIKVPDVKVIMDRDETQALFFKLLLVEGVDKVDYDGHFGHYVYVKVDDNDHEHIMGKVLKVITDHISEES